MTGFSRTGSRLTSAPISRQTSPIAEQFLKAYTIDLAALDAIVGANDAKFVTHALEHDLADEVADLIEEADLALEQVLTEITEGKLDTKHAYGYRRALELLAAVVGNPIESWEATMPGRGWHELGPAWKRWYQGILARIWGGARSNNVSFPWPWKKSDNERDADWPVAVAIPNKDLPALRTELARFDKKTVVERGVPQSIDRFGDPEHWPLEELADEIENVVTIMTAFVGDASEANADLLIWHDGQQ